MIFPNSCPRFTLLTELNLTVPKARPEAHTFDFIVWHVLEDKRSEETKWKLEQVSAAEVYRP